MSFSYTHPFILVERWWSIAAALRLRPGPPHNPVLQQPGIDVNRALVLLVQSSNMTKRYDAFHVSMF